MMNTQRFTHIFKQNGFWIALYLLLRDALALSLLAFAGLMTLEGLMPGLVSAHFNLAKILFGIALLFFAYTGIGQHKNISAPSGSISRWPLAGLLLWSSLLVLNSLIKFPFYAIITIFLLTVIIGKLLYDEFFENN